MSETATFQPSGATTPEPAAAARPEPAEPLVRREADGGGVVRLTINRGGDHHHPGRLVGLHDVELGLQGAERGFRQGIEGVGPVQRDAHDAALITFA